MSLFISMAKLVRFKTLNSRHTVFSACFRVLSSPMCISQTAYEIIIHLEEKNKALKTKIKTLKAENKSLRGTKPKNSCGLSHVADLHIMGPIGHESWPRQTFANEPATSRSDSDDSCTSEFGAGDSGFCGD